MARLNVKPTRMELNQLKIRLTTAKRGHKLLKDKRDELMRQFISLIKENYRLRKEVEKSLSNNLKDFVSAKALINTSLVNELFLAPSKEISLIIEEENVMSVTVPKMIIDISDNKQSLDLNYSYLASNSDMDKTFTELNLIADKMLHLAEVEKKCQLMADEIEKTRRRVNGLEYLTIPNLEETIHYIELKLEEADRSNIIRIMKVK
ncbi:V-type ATP synthase subunit D [Lactobacillus mulieris]|jgi:V-type ATPase, D subunit|uniref:V-type ATP synthase subunit D n=1 Tax=Lactobacillus TaxID=1578 RepID=UPI001179AD37|nr:MULTISPECIES: V-type ATP synthase subunit D [Lactobacillus]KAA9244017.1 V-type ATP synthase subunit D [Lactobacillus jensenii]MCW8124260.1 V-type ATP synthase subunit D [Lactobacillus mulieris]MCZ9599380.1 V-type ATP synthase subunit D [Lactobacillus mulieris]MDK7327475.1 V-type ATP synthase subunit D [Lactobacillus mulieris]TRT38384.1 V-type ATP synthase subunit D [Lactobacillus sp. c10Ua232AE]